MPNTIPGWCNTQTKPTAIDRQTIRTSQSPPTCGSLTSNLAWHLAICVLFVAPQNLMALGVSHCWQHQADGSGDSDDESSRNPAPETGASLNAQIEQALADLDAPSYKTRERAKLQLAKFGGEALKSLAFHSLNCSPEAQWRIRKTLEDISINGDEDVCFKALGLLKFRYDIESTTNSTLTQSLQQLEAQWRLKRKQAAIKRLRQLGAVVNDPIEDAMQDGREMALLLGQNVIFTNRAYGAAPAPAKRKPKINEITKLSPQQARAQINEILMADIDTNRNRVFELDEEPDPDAAELTENVPGRVAIENQIRVQRLLAGAGASYNGPGLTIEIGQDWQGTSEDLLLLKDLRNVQVLTLSQQTISKQNLATFGNISTLSQLTLDACDVEQDILSDGQWPSLRELEFKNCLVDSALLESCSEIASLQMLNFNSCQLQDSALVGLESFKRLRGLQFKDTDIDKSVFDALVSLKQVSYLNLAVCKFNTADYKAFKAKRPNLQIAYKAQAFFGVRGGPTNLAVARPFDQPHSLRGVDAESDPCEISEVIPDSGAARAGIKIGDVIESVDGQAIMTFEDLKLHIAQHRAGDVLNVTIQRDGQAVKLKVELASQKTAPRF
ncbi:MAG: hypothetical protein ACI87E_000613 [Mariniblastus sp.]|jgi:hypothetical protein